MCSGFILDEGAFLCESLLKTVGDALVLQLECAPRLLAERHSVAPGMQWALLDLLKKHRRQSQLFFMTPCLH